VIGCQWDLAWEDKDRNFSHVRELLAQETIPPGSLVALPEMFATGFSMNVEQIAENEDGPTAAFLSSVAKQFQSTIIGGAVTRAAGGRGWNEALVASPDGSIAARYQKLHPFSYGGEADHYARGQSLVVVKCGEFLVAPLVCYDLRFPEVFRLAVRAGAQAFVVIANWPAPRVQHWITLLQARAIENQAYVIGVNRVGNDGRLSYNGHSLVIDPRGQIIAAAETGEGLLKAQIELEPLLQYRREFPALADMRSEFLGLT
jgi:omega-amidase